jgi:peptidoglycan/LPS O-acetylase OafA/YrhL
MGFIRLLLAISVIIADTSAIFGFNIVGGSYAVQSFYIISGFYMSLILNEKYVGKNDSYLLFLSNRLLRLYPVYWTVLVIMLVHSLVLFLKTGHPAYTIGLFLQYQHQMKLSTICYLIFANIFLVSQDLVMFLGLNIHTGGLFFTKDFSLTDPKLFSFLFVPQAWTIGVEILFYIVAPFLVRRSIIVVGLIMGLSLLSVVWIVHAGLPADPWLDRFFPAQLVYFLAGNLSYRAYKKIQDRKIKKFYLLGITLSLILFILFFFKLNFPRKTTLYFILFASALPFIFKYTKRLKIDNKIGELSYPVYISHMFVYTLIGGLGFTQYLGKGLTVAIFSILFSMLLNRFVAEPMEKFRQNRVSKHLKNKEAYQSLSG